MPNRIGNFKHNTEWLKEQYTINQKSAVEIAKMMGVTSGAVYDMLKRRNIPRRNRSEVQILDHKTSFLRDKQLLNCEYVKKRKTTEEIGIEFNVNPETIRKLLIGYGIKRRSVGTRFEIKELRSKKWLFDKYMSKNMSQLQISEILGCGETIVNRWIKKHGINKSTRWSGNDIFESNKKRSNFSYREWRKKVKNRDTVCMVCGSVKNLQAHHIKPFAYYKELRYVSDNGITLCKACHMSEHRSSQGRLLKQKLGETGNLLLGQLRTKLHEFK